VGQFKSRPEPTELMIRATLIFQREYGAWKAVHRHGDNGGSDGNDVPNDSGGWSQGRRLN
jgi:hypothetical protein